MITFDARTVDSTGAFLMGELERLDPEIHLPLVDYQWARDIPVRKDVALADEFSSFTTTSFAAPGGATNSGISWAGKNSSAVAGMAVDTDKTATALNLWAMELSWTVVELEQSMKTGRPIDADKLAGLNLKWQMDMDNVGYIGDTGTGVTGLLNASGITPANVVNGASASPLWSSKTGAEILADVNSALAAAWSSAAYAVAPNRLLVAPSVYTYLLQPINIAGYQSVLDYVKKNNISTQNAGVELEIYASKWCTGAGAGGTNRMVAYNKDYRFLRIPYTDLNPTAPQFRSLWQNVTYFCKIGGVEIVRKEAIVYRDGM